MEVAYPGLAGPLGADRSFRHAKDWMSRRTLARVLVAVGVGLSGAIGLAPKVSKLAAWPLLGVATAIAVYLIIVCQIGGHYLKGAGRREAIREFLEYIHRRSWGRTGGGKDPDYRVSFWIPMRTWWCPWEEKLGCCHRTDGRRTKHRWSMDPPEDGRDGHGLVGMIWRTEISPSIAALREDADDDERARYWRETQLGQDEREKRSWKGAAMTGKSVRVKAGSDPTGVLLVECRTPSVLIDPNTIHEDPRLFAILWEGGL